MQGCEGVGEAPRNEKGEEFTVENEVVELMTLNAEPEISLHAIMGTHTLAP